MTPSKTVEDKPDLKARLNLQKKNFLKIFGEQPSVIIRSPGRAEVLGNHTDYNNGFALACAISKSTIALLRKRGDKIIQIHSTAYPNKVLKFNINEFAKFKRDKLNTWCNYPKAVVKQLVLKDYKIGGADILIESNVPKSGGVSSSAAYELAITRGIQELYDLKYNPLKTAYLCQQAENSDIVKSPCGFLDQGTVAFAKKDHLVFFDFLPKNNYPISKSSLIPINLEKHKMTFVITVDATLERQLGESGYVQRRKTCEASLPILSKFLKKRVNSLRDITLKEFKAAGPILFKENKKMEMRVKHVVTENNRVLAAVKFLQKDNLKSFGRMMTESGRSALEFYELDEKTPQLTHLVKKSREIEGVIGTRNMGGGFSANIISLVENSKLQNFKEVMNRSYLAKFGQGLEFIVFEAAAGLEVLESNSLQ